VERLEDRCVLSTSTYVSGLYANLLHRSATAAEVAGWVNLIDGGAQPEQVTLAFTGSPEFQTNLIRTDYQAFLRREPTAGDVAFWLGQFQAGLREDQFEAVLLGSNEYFNAHGANGAGWVAGVFNDVLGRAPDGAALAHFNQGLAVPGLRNQAALTIVDSTEAHARVVAGIYEQLLLRPPDPAGASLWVNFLNQGMTPSQLVAVIAASPEFIARTSAGGLDVPTQFTPGLIPVPVTASAFRTPVLTTGAIVTTPVVVTPITTLPFGFVPITTLQFGFVPVITQFGFSPFTIGAFGFNPVIVGTFGFNPLLTGIGFNPLTNTQFGIAPLTISQIGFNPLANPMFAPLVGPVFTGFPVVVTPIGFTTVL
jgi:hypothetical protein